LQLRCDFSKDLDAADTMSTGAGMLTSYDEPQCRHASVIGERSTMWSVFLRFVMT
jgi:hypothetical protein